MAAPHQGALSTGIDRIMLTLKPGDKARIFWELLKAKVALDPAIDVPDAAALASWLGTAGSIREANENELSSMKLLRARIAAKSADEQQTRFQLEVATQVEAKALRMDRERSEDYCPENIMMSTRMGIDLPLHMKIDMSALVKTAREQKANLEDALRVSQASIKEDEASLGQLTASVLDHLDTLLGLEACERKMMQAQLALGEQIEKKKQLVQKQSSIGKLCLRSTRGRPRPIDSATRTSAL